MYMSAKQIGNGILTRFTEISVLSNYFLITSSLSKMQKPRCYSLWITYSLGEFLPNEHLCRCGVFTVNFFKFEDC